MPENTSLDKVLFDAEGNAYHLDPSTNTLIKIEKDLDAARRTEDGHFRPEVKRQAFALYVAGDTWWEIANKMGISKHTVRKWAVGVDCTATHPKCFYQKRKRYIEEMLERNTQAVVAVNKGLLGKMKDFVEDERIKVKTTSELKDVADSYAKLNMLDGGKSTKVTVNVPAPMTMEEARSAIQNDPVLVVEAETVDGPETNTDSADT